MTTLPTESDLLIVNNDTKLQPSAPDLSPVLAEQMAQSGRWLFRRRSFLPLLLAPLVVGGLCYFHYPNHSLLLDRVRELCCLLVSIAGLLMRVGTVGFVLKGSSGRNTKAMKAEHINTTGMYSVVRHPLYVANFIVALGVFLLIGPWWLVLIGSLFYWLCFERVMLAEETVLFNKFGEQFTQWSAVTPAAFPNFRRWQSPEEGFSIRSVIRREYTTLFLVILLFTLVEVAGEFVIHGKLGIDPIWAVIFAVGLVWYLTVRFIKKCTTLLQVKGR